MTWACPLLQVDLYRLQELVIQFLRVIEAGPTRDLLNQWNMAVQYKKDRAVADLVMPPIVKLPQEVLEMLLLAPVYWGEDRDGVQAWKRIRNLLLRVEVS